MKIDAKSMDFITLNNTVREASGDIVIDNCMGQRFIGSGAKLDKNIIINGTPGNALGVYLDGATIVVNGNAQDAVGDTMNDGTIIINGNAGDALGYAMRGGKIYIKGDSGYRTGIHMKQYKDKKPVLIVGGSTGSFLGEYLAGGIIIVLGLNENKPIINNFTGTGMHGGMIALRSKDMPTNLPRQVAVRKATQEDMKILQEYLEEYSCIFGIKSSKILTDSYFILVPNMANPYKRLYTAN